MGSGPHELSKIFEVTEYGRSDSVVGDGGQ
jgi:hypothetical protein